MNPPVYEENDTSLFSLNTLCYPTSHPPSPKYLASTKQDHLCGIQYQPLPRPQYPRVTSPAQKVPSVNPDIRYHAVPNQHQSDDEDARQDEHLLVSDENVPNSSSRLRTVQFNITAYTRILACIFGITSFLLCFQGRIPVPGAFSVVCSVRNVHVLLGHYFRRFITMRFLNIQIIIGPVNAPAALGQTKSSQQPNGKRYMAVVAILIDLGISFALLITIPITFQTIDWWNLNAVHGLVTGCIVIALQLLSALDAGQPDTVNVETGFLRSKRNALKLVWNLEINSPPATEDEEARG